MSSPNTITGIIIAKNAADTLELSLQSLFFCDEIVVVIDDASQDDSETIARRYTDKVFKQTWLGYGKQKNFALEHATSIWVLFLDADEEVTSELQRAIRQAIEQGTSSVYWIHIVTTFLGKPLHHLYGHNPRLFQKHAARWTDAKVHEQLITSDGTIVKLGDYQHAVLVEPILHHSHRTIRSYLTKMHHYTSLDAAQMQRTGEHRSGRPLAPSLFLPYTLALRQFIKMYFYRKGILDGFAGFMWCLLSSYYEWEMGIKYNRKQV